MHSNSQQFIYRLQLNRPELLTQGATETESAVLQDHVAYLERLAGTGTVLLAGRTQTDSPDDFGIVLLQANSEETALDIMDNDPAVKHDVMKAELFPYKIAVISDSILKTS